jgi:hypothetical protein
MSWDNSGVETLPATEVLGHLQGMLEKRVLMLVRHHRFGDLANVRGTLRVVQERSDGTMAVVVGDAGADGDTVLHPDRITHTFFLGDRLVVAQGEFVVSIGPVS